MFHAYPALNISQAYPATSTFLTPSPNPCPSLSVFDCVEKNNGEAKLALEMFNKRCVIAEWTELVKGMVQYWLQSSGPQWWLVLTLHKVVLAGDHACSFQLFIPIFTPAQLHCPDFFSNGNTLPIFFSFQQTSAETSSRVWPLLYSSSLIKISTTSFVHPTH